MAERVARGNVRRQTGNFSNLKNAVAPLRRSGFFDNLFDTGGGAYVTLADSEVNLEELPDDFFQSQASKGSGTSDELAWVLESPGFQGLAAILIVSNAVVIGMETDNGSWRYWDGIEHCFLMAFTVELGFRLYVQGALEFFACRRDLMWNLLDVVVVSLGLLDATANLLKQGLHPGFTATLFRIIRLLRILRIFRIIRFLKQLYLLAYGLAEAAQAVFWVTVLMTFVLYVCSIVLVRFVGHAGPGDPHELFLQNRFGNVGTSMFSLFELMASPNLPEYASQEGLLQAHPFLTFFLVSFVIFGSFGMIALLTGVISESMFEKNQLRIEEERQEREAVQRWMQGKCKQLFNKLKQTTKGKVLTGDVAHALPLVQRLFDAAQVDYMREELYGILNVMDTDGDGLISEEEFCHAIVTLAAGVRSISLQELWHVVCLISKGIRDLRQDIQALIEAQDDARIGGPRRGGRNKVRFREPEDYRSEDHLEDSLDEAAGAASSQAPQADPLMDQMEELQHELQTGMRELGIAGGNMQDKLERVAAGLREELRQIAEQLHSVMPVQDVAHREPGRPVLPGLVDLLGGPDTQRSDLDPCWPVPEAACPPDLAAMEQQFRTRLSGLLRANADALVKVVALEARTTFGTSAPGPEQTSEGSADCPTSAAPLGTESSVPEMHLAG